MILFTNTDVSAEIKMQIKIAFIMKILSLNLLTFSRPNSNLVNPYKTLLLAWGNYSDGTYALSESIVGRAISIAVGINGRLRGTWIPTSINDIRSIVIPGGGVIDVKILSATQVQITGTTPDYRVREIFAI